ncbi:MAG: sugar transferase [Bacteroidales bacterium]|nr:sugar transferase [Bacteroidales bacterium]
MYKLFFKRISDIIISLLAVIILFPVIFVIGFFIYIIMGYPVFFKQIRPGKDTKLFTLLKFRTMTNKKDVKGEFLPNEMRITPFGRFLRKTSLDELPELFNVLKGDMSLVGPRPLRVEYLKYYSPEQNRRHEVKPGITGWAQINGRNAIRWEKKFKLDVWYVDHQNFWLDIKILWKTVAKVLKREGINTSDDEFVKPFKGSKLDG